MPTLSTPTSPLSAPPPSTPTILHHPLHLFLILHLPSPCIQQLLTIYLLLPLFLAQLSSSIHCVPLSTPPLFVLFSPLLGSVPLSSLFAKVEFVPHPQTIPSHLSIPDSQQGSGEARSYPAFTTSPTTTYSTLFSLDFTLPTQPKVFSTAKKYVGAAFLDLSKASSI